MKQIRTAGIHDKKKIADLRIKEYSRSKDFKLVKPEKLLWNEADEANTVLGVWNETGEAIATLRLVSVADEEAARAVLKSDLPDTIAYPAMVFNAAATRIDHRRQGLNQLLRYYGIQKAREMGSQSLLSPIFQESPRLKFMLKLGYVCHNRPQTFHSKLIPSSPRILCILNADMFDCALAAIEQAVPDLMSAYPWTDRVIRY